MNRGAAQVRSYTGIAMSTNKSAAVMISANDRRYNVGVHQPKRIVLSQEEIDEQIPKELEAFMCYLMTRTANKGVAAQALKNAAHAELVESNKTSIDVLVTQLADGDIMSLWDSVTDPNIAMALRAESAAFSFEYHKILKREITEMCLSQTSSYQDKVLKKMKTNVEKIVTCESRLSRDELMVVFEHVKTERLRINGALHYGLRTEWKAPKSWIDERMAEFALTAPKSRLARVK
jgi:ribosomal protein L12E/L44/L45/RPP1/RPP2